MTLELNREPSEEELAQKMNVSIDKIRDIYKVSQDSVSLEMPIGESDDMCLKDLIPDDESKTIEEYVNSEMLKDTISEALSIKLTEREEKVIRLRFGFEDGKSRTLEEVGQMFGVTRERIRQIQSRALRKLYNSKYRRELESYLDESITPESKGKSISNTLLVDQPNIYVKKASKK